MRIRHDQIAAGSLALLITFGVNAKAAQPDKILKMVQQVKIFTPPAETEKAAKEILKLDPKSGDAHAMLAWSQYRLPGLDSAIEIDKKAIGLKFRDVFWQRRAFNILYHSYIDKKDWAQALKYCLLCYKVERSSGVAHDLSILYDRTGNAKLSKEYALTAERLSSDVRRQFERTRIERREANDPKTVDIVLDRVDEGLAKNPKDTDALLLRARCYRTKKLYTKELADINTVIGMTPERGYLYHRRSEVYKSLGDTKKSASDELEAKKRGFDAEKIMRELKIYIKNHRIDDGSTTGSGTVNPDDIHDKPE